MLALVILLKVADDFLVWPKQTDRRKKDRESVGEGGKHSGNYVSSGPTLGGLMICLMFLTIMCLATQKNILCKLLKLYHQQQHEQSERESKGKEEGESRVWHLISHSLGPHPWIHLPLRLLSPLCHRLCLLSNVNGVAFACLGHPLPPATYPLLSSPCCSVHMRATFWRLSIWAFCGATPAKSSLAYLCAPGLLFVLPPSPFTSLSLFVFLGFLLRE